MTAGDQELPKQRRAPHLSQMAFPWTVTQLKARKTFQFSHLGMKPLKTRMNVAFKEIFLTLHALGTMSQVQCPHENLIH